MQESRHAITAAIASARSTMAGVAGSPAWSLTPEQLEAGLVEAHALAAQVADLELRLVAQADHDDLAGAAGSTSTAAWWAGLTGQDRVTAKRRARLAAALDGDRSATREALARGEVDEPQARVIADAVAALPDDLDGELAALAEKTLITDATAARFDPIVLKRLGDRILEVVAPDLAEAHQLQALQAEEDRAREQARFSISHRGDGVAAVRATLPSTTAEALRRMVLAHWTPALGDGPKAQGQALIELIERYPVDRLPDHGGLAPTITVTMTLAQLRGDLDAAGVVTLDTGQRLTAGEARRLACEAHLIPVVLGRKSAVLDVGRAARFHTRPQRVAIAHRDRTCTAEGCDYPPGLCHVHHDIPWALGGRTSVEDGRLLCPAHHRMIHSGRYQTSPAEGGRLVFRRT